MNTIMDTVDMGDLTCEETEDIVRYQLLENCKKFRELFDATVLKDGQKRIACEVVISYNPNGNDNFCFYDSNNNLLTIDNLDPSQSKNITRITFRNDGEQIEKFHRRVNVFLNPSMALNSITVHYISERTYMMSDLRSVLEWGGHFHPTKISHFFLEIV